MFLFNLCRLFVYTLQHYVLFVFRNVLVLSPSLLDVFRSEGVWDFIFSENFFYFGPVSADSAGEYCSFSEVLPWNNEKFSDTNSTDPQVNTNQIEILQIEVISILEFAATLNGNSHNLVGSICVCSIYLCPDMYAFVLACIMFLFCFIFNWTNGTECKKKGFW